MKKQFKSSELPPIHGNTREELGQASEVYARSTPGFELTLTLVDEIGCPKGYISIAQARLIANWLQTVT